MLYADKRNLEVNLQVALLRIRDKELTFFTDNLTAIGTQAAMLSGFAYTGIIMTHFEPDGKDFQGAESSFSNIFGISKLLQGCFLCTSIAAMSLELMTVGGSMIAAIYGPGLGLRGPDGSMHRAVDGMMLEYKLAFMLFSTGLFPFLVAAFFFALMQFHWAISIPMAAGLGLFIWDMWRYFKHIYQRFALKEVITGRFDISGAPSAGDRVRPERPAASVRPERPAASASGASAPWAAASAASARAGGGSSAAAEQGSSAAGVDPARPRRIY